MKKSKLYRLFTTLSPEQINRFSNFVNTHYYNTRTDVKKLCNYCSSTQEWSLAEAHNSIFPKKEYSSSRLRNTQTHLLQLLRKFVIYERLERQPEQGQILLLQIYREWMLDKEFSESWRKGEQLVEDFPYKGEQYYALKAKMQQELFLH